MRSVYQAYMPPRDYFPTNRQFVRLLVALHEFAPRDHNRVGAHKVYVPRYEHFRTKLKAAQTTPQSGNSTPCDHYAVDAPHTRLCTLFPHCTDLCVVAYCFAKTAQPRDRDAVGARHVYVPWS